MKCYQIKIILLGESGVGKTSIIERFKGNPFDENYKPSMGASFASKNIKIPESEDVIKFQLWDTAGQEIYRSLASLYYKDAHAAILVYDITNPKSFQELKYWSKELKEKATSNPILAVAANKADLMEKEQVDITSAKKFANEINSIYKQTSAKERIGIDELFLQIAVKACPGLDERIIIQEEPDTVMK